MIAERLEWLGCVFDRQYSFRRSSQYFSAAAIWFSMAGQEDRLCLSRRMLAEEWVSDGEQVANSLSAARCYERAVQLYQSIPKSRRRW